MKKIKIKDKQPMKELKEWYAGLSMSSVQSNHVGNSRRQQRPTNLLQTLILLAIMLVSTCGVGAKATKDASFQTPAANGSWNEETNTYSWTEGSNNLMSMFELTTEELNNYEKLQLTTTNYTDGQPYRVCFLNGSSVVAQIDFYSAGEKNLVFSERTETKDKDLSQVTSIQFGGLSASGSITIDPSSVKLIAKPKVTFSTPDAFGATIPDGCLTAKIKDTETVVNSGDYIPTGTVVVFTAKQYSNNAAHDPVPASRLVLQGWKINDNETVDKTNIPTTGIVWSDATSTYETTINDDFDIKTEYGFSYVLNINTAEHGSAAAKIGGTDINSYSGFRGNTNVTLTATPADGYALDYWKVHLNGAGGKVWPEDAEDGNMGSDNPFTLYVDGSTFENKWGNDVYVTPVFKEVVNYTVSFGAIDTSDATTVMGSVTATTSDGTVLTSGKSVEEGTVVTFTATPASSDYLAWGWKENDVRNYQGSTVSRTITADITMNAVFNAGITLEALTSSSSTNYGTTRIECSGDRGTSFHTNPGTPNVQFVATPKKGVTFEGWYSDDACNTFVSKDNPYIIANPENSERLYAKFTLPDGTHAVIWSVKKDSNDGTPDGCEAWFTIGDDDTQHKESVFGIADGTKVTLHATDGVPNFIFAKYDVNGVGKWNNKTYEATISGDLTVIANFCSAFTYNATANVPATLHVYKGDGETNDINGQKQKSWDELTKVTFKSSAETGLTFTGWYNGEGTKVSDNETYVIDAPSKTSTTLEARYTIPAPIGGQRVKAQLGNIGKGNVPTWENGHFATDATSYNHADIFQFGTGKNVTNSADNYTGIRFNVKGATPCRILVYVNGETNTRITNVPAGSAGNKKEYVYTWADLGVPASSVANIERVCFAGQQNGPTDVIFSDVWVEKIDDPCHTFVTYGETGGVYNNGTYTYTIETPEGNATAVFSGIAGGDRKGYTNEIKLKDNLVITAPSGKRIKAVKLITDAQASELVFTGKSVAANDAYDKAITDGYEVVWTHDNVESVTITNANTGTKIANIAKIEVIYDNGKTNAWDPQKHPALSKQETGKYVVDLDKINSYGGYAYDAETHTVYSSSTSAYGGNINIQFETPQDFSYLTKIALGTSNKNLITFIDFVPTEGDNITLSISSVDDWNNIAVDDIKTQLTGKLIKQVTFASSSATSSATTINYIGFDISHIEPKVALDTPTTTEYTMIVGQTLNVGAHATAGEEGPNHVLWEQYESADATSPMANPAFAAKYNSTLEFTPTAVGTYYLGARAYQNCKTHIDDGNDHYAFSTPAIITVTVNPGNLVKDVQLSVTSKSPTDRTQDVTVDRSYKIYVPKKVLDAPTKAVPVVFSLHGTGEDNDPTRGVPNFNALAEADENGFIVIYPLGRKLYFEGWGGTGNGWEATGTADNNDTKFFEAILKDLGYLDVANANNEYKTDGAMKFTIDKSRIYMAGFSNGGMMAYATANAMADKFAAFASISGLPMNEMHMRTHNARPVPFLHIHGTKDTFVKYTHMPTVVDNMLFRNGLPITPTRIVEGSANGGATRYKMSEYSATDCMPYYYFEIGTGSNTSDTGMGHEWQCTIGDKSSAEVMWEFFKDLTLPSPITNPFEFKACINSNNNAARDHGWQTNTSSGILAQYGESGGYTVTGENVYNTIQLKAGEHTLKFHTTGETTHHVLVRVVQLCEFGNDNFDTMGKHTVAIKENPIVDNVAYMVQNGSDVVVPFSTTKDGEFLISIIKGGKWDNTTVSDITIVPGTEAPTATPDHPVDTDFGGYFNYNNRLFAQWNFDLSDGFRANARKLETNSNTGEDNRAWTANLSNTDYNGATLNNGTIVFENYKALGTDLENKSKDTDLSTYHELTYNGIIDKNDPNYSPIPVAAGLKFKAPVGSLKIYVDITNGQVSGAHLVVNEDVKMYVPYVTNSYRNDKDEFSQPQDHKDDFKNCMHHINRDMIYIALNQGTIWDEWNNGHFVSQGHVKNECIDLEGQDLFRNGGDEFVNGKNYNKADYMGKAGTPCIIRFNRETIIDRIGVNRNMTYSFYTEYISELGMTKPSVRQRIVGSPTGQKIANDGDTWTEYTNAVAFTYGGWKNNKGGKSYTAYNDDGGSVTVTDDWSQLGVYCTDGFHTWSDMPTPTAESVVPTAIDGFPVATMSTVPATSEKLMPKSTTGNIYHPADDGALRTGSYTPNVTPWTLPCRGAYGKYEVSYPGVLNIDVVLEGAKDYYITDEFGKKINQEIITKTATDNNDITGSNPYRVPKTDYVKFSFNAYPGKTYYIFSNNAGLGLSGFYYEPFVYRPKGGGEDDREYVGYREIVLKDDVAFSTSMAEYASSLEGSETIQSPTESGHQDYTIHYSKDAVKVTLNRSFKKDTWNSICVPYSINQAQLENVFGVGTEVVLLRDIRKAGTEGYDNSTINFIRHANQDIIAGYPYLIMPTKDVSKVVTYACLSDGQVATEPMNSITSDNISGVLVQQDWCMSGFTFTGTFQPNNTLPKGSYYISGKGNLSQVKEKTITLQGYRAWLNYQPAPELGGSAKSIQQALVNDLEEIEIEQVTGIEEVTATTIGTTKSSNAIYNINGQMVGKNISDIHNLPKGIYIINGRKYIAK